MTQIQDDLICEIIRTSQINFLKDQSEAGRLEWIQKNAKKYREHFASILASFPSGELSRILEKLRNTGEDLTQLLDKCAWNSS